MRPLEWLLLSLLCLAPAAPSGAVEVFVHVQDAATADPIAGASVLYLFNPGTALADSVDGVTDGSGNLTLFHDLVSAVPEISSSSISRPYPNPAGSRAAFDIQTAEKDAGNLHLAMYDLRGRLVGQGPVGAGDLQLDHALASGNYLYRVTDGRRDLASGKLSVMGILERIQFKRTASVGAAKSGSDPVDILIRAAGYDDLTTSQTLGEGTHTANFALTRSAATGTLALDVWNITGEMPLAQADVVVLNQQGESFTGTTDANGEVMIDYTVQSDLDSLRIFLDDYPGFTNGTAALIDTSLPVVAGGRIDAVSCFFHPDTLMVAASDPRILAPVRMQVLSDAHFMDEVIRDGVSIIFQRGRPFETEILTTCFSFEWPGVYGPPAPVEVVAWMHGVAAHIQDELIQPNGTILNLSTIVERDSLSWKTDDIHYIACDHTHTGGWNGKGPADEEGFMTYAYASVPPVGVSYGLVMEEYIGGWLWDNPISGSSNWAFDLVDPNNHNNDSPVILNERGRVGMALHHMMKNGTNCDPG